MDCGTCDLTGPIQVMKPEVVDCEITMTAKAKAMLEEAFGEVTSVQKRGVLRARLYSALKIKVRGDDVGNLF